MKNENEPTTDTPETVFPAGVSILHPLTLSAASIHTCLQPMSEHANLLELADNLTAALDYEGIYDPHDTAVMLASQARTLDAVFNRFILQGFAPDRNPDLEKIRFAMMAQRQCTTVIDKLNRRKRRKRKMQNQNIDDQNEGHKK